MHLEALIPEAKDISVKLKNFRNFYLVGGTALALQIGHRVSVDFDLFSDKKIPEDLLNGVEKIFSDYQIDVLVNNPNELTIFLNKVKTTFFRYPFPVILGFIDFQKIKILKILEIAAMKAYVLGRRATYKDYIDLYFILSEKHCFLKEIIKIAQKKYGDKFDQRLFLEQLIYLEDVKDMKIQFLKKIVRRKELQSFFEKEVKKIKLI